MDLNKEKFKTKYGVDFDSIDTEMFNHIGIKEENSERISTKPYSYWKTVGRLLFKNKAFMFCAAILILFVTLSIIVPQGKEVFPLVKEFNSPQNPTWKHIFGLGLQGEDFWVEIWAGMRTTLLFALLISLIQIVTGILLGAVWGYFRKTDIFFIQITNFLSLIPQLILLLLIVFLIGQGYWPMVIGVSIQAWITIAAIVRVQIMLVKNADYNTASISLGSKSGKIIRKNIMPKILPSIVQTGAFAIPSAISIDSTLSFLNLGFIKSEDRRFKTSLGDILNTILGDSSKEIYPHLIIIPLLFIALISVIFFIVAKIFADALDPKNHR